MTTSAWPAELEQLLRRYAVAVYGREAVARLSGRSLARLHRRPRRPRPGRRDGPALLRAAYGGPAQGDRARWLEGARGFLEGAHDDPRRLALDAALPAPALAAGPLAAARPAAGRGAVPALRRTRLATASAAGRPDPAAVRASCCSFWSGCCWWPPPSVRNGWASPQPVPTTGRRLLLAVDVSGSMATQDMAGDATRLQVVQKVAGDFIRHRHGDQVGLILFGTRPYLQAPLTTDLDTVSQFLDEAVIGVAGTQTAIGDAIGLAIKRLRDDPSQAAHKGDMVLILLTDGSNDAGVMPPSQAARMAAAAGLRIYTIGVGAADASRLLRHRRQQRPGRGHAQAHRAASPAANISAPPMPTRWNRSTRASTSWSPAPRGNSWYRPRDEWFAWPLGLALLLSLPAVMWSGRQWRLMPELSFPASGLAAGPAAALGAEPLARPAPRRRRRLDPAGRSRTAAGFAPGRRRQARPLALALAGAGLDPGGAGAGRTELAAAPALAAYRGNACLGAGAGPVPFDERVRPGAESLTRARYALDDLLDGARDARVGLVVFSDEALYRHAADRRRRDHSRPAAAAQARHHAQRRRRSGARA